MALRLDPEQAAVHRQHGKAWEAQGRFSKAVADFNEAIRIDPHNARAYLDRARVLLSFP